MITQEGINGRKMNTKLLRKICLMKFKFLISIFLLQLRSPARCKVSQTISIIKHSFGVVCLTGKFRIIKQTRQTREHWRNDNRFTSDRIVRKNKTMDILYFVGVCYKHMNDRVNFHLTDLLKYAMFIVSFFFWIY